MITKCVAPEATVTLTALLLPVSPLLSVSVAVTVWLPAVFSVTLKVPTPLVNVALAGRTAARVAAGKVDRARYSPPPCCCCTSSAVIWILKAAPAVAVGGAVTTKCVAGKVTFTALLVPVSELLAVSVAVSVWLPLGLQHGAEGAVPAVKRHWRADWPAASLLVKWTVPV